MHTPLPTHICTPTRLEQTDAAQGCSLSAMVSLAEPETPPITPEGGGGREGKKKGERGPRKGQ